MNLQQHMTKIAIERMLDICPACHIDLYNGSHSILIDGYHDRCVSPKYDADLVPAEVHSFEWGTTTNQGSNQ